MRIPLMKHLSWYLIVAMFIIGITPRVEAGIAPSEVVAMSQTDRAADIEKVQKALETKMVRERLEQLGFTQEEIQGKLSGLSDQQLHQLALQIDDVKTGGLDAIIFLLVIVIIIVLFLQLAGKKVVVEEQK